MSLRSVGKIKDTTVVTLRHPNPRENLVHPDGTPMTVTIHGPYSARHKAVLRERQQKWLAQAGSDGGQLGVTSDELDDSARAMVIACVETWDITLEGEDRLPFSPEAVPEVFDEFPWVYDQVAAAMGNIANFLDVPSKP
jgi:hypothetical protein